MRSQLPSFTVANEVGAAEESEPQRLKPQDMCSVYGTDKSVPLSKTNTEILAAPE
jgi:hypothetical protein